MSQSRPDPYAAFAELRTTDPVSYNERSGEWILSRYDDVQRALADPATFSSAQGTSPAGDWLPLLMDDPPRHTRLRRLVNSTFTPRSVRELQVDITRIATELVHALDEGEADIVDSLAVPLPVRVIALLLGFPEEDWRTLKHWSDASVGVPRPAKDQREVVDEMRCAFAGAVAERRSSPGADLLSLFAHAELDGDRIDDPIAVGLCEVLLQGGNETTTSLIENMMNVLVDRPELWARLRQDRDLVDNVVNETLRFDSPLQMLWRRTTQAVELRGKEIPPDSLVMLAFASANRDEERFTNADHFDPDRPLAPHLAFGSGAHHCLGAPLVRTEAATALNAMLDRFERLERGDGDAVRLESAVIRGFETLPIRLIREN